jgi:hypothetical protein
VRWSRRGPEIPPLPEAPRVSDLPDARLDSSGRYLGTTTGEGNVTAHGLGRRGSVRVRLSEEALDVVRLGAPFRIPVAALRGARQDGDVLVVRWAHGEQVLETAFRLKEADLAAWVRRISKLARKQAAG